MSEWMWFVVRENINGWSILAGPFSNNQAARAAAKDKANIFKGTVFVVESTDIAEASDVRIRAVKHGEAKTPRKEEV